MKCPKCHYLSFDPEPRCKNCGYDLFSENDLPIRQETPTSDALAELSLHEPDPEPAARPRPSTFVPAAPPPLAFEPDLAPAPVSAFAGPASRRSEPSGSDLAGAALASAALTSSAPATPAPARVPARPAPVTTELPLFVKGMGTAEANARAALESDEPLVKVPAEPRPPLAVRRKAPDTGSQKRPAASPRKLGPLERDLLEDLQRIERTERREARAETVAAFEEAPSERAGAVKRLAAAAVDGVFLGFLAMAILWVTLRWVDVPFADLTDQRTLLPLLPTGVFLVLLGIGYLLLFTAASGQTLGKMLLGLRVIADEPEAGAARHVSLKQAVWRAVLTVPSVLALGAGFIPALMGDERAVHDRLAHTRVVRA